MRRLIVALIVAGCTSTVAEPGTTIAIEPATATLQIENGAIVTQQFTARRADGTSVPSGSATWTVSDPRVGAIDDTGTFTPTGDLGGVVAIDVAAGGLQGTAMLTVKLHIVDPADSLDPTTRAQLIATAAQLPRQAASQDPAIAWAYPYDGTVMPRGLEAPRLMWNGGLDQDWYYIHLTSATFELETFLHLNAVINDPGPDSQFQLAQSRWKQLAESTSGAVDLVVSRFAGGVATGVIHHQWTIAPAHLPGTIYYWTMRTETGTAAGRLRALDLGGVAADFLGDYRPNGTEGCPKCHTPSADGSRVALVMQDPATWPTTESVAYDIAAGTTLYAGFPSLPGGWGDAALSPHGDVLVESFAGIRTTLGVGATSGAFDPTTATQIPNTGLESIRPWMPAFSPDDQLLVYVDETPTPGGCQFGSGQGSSDGPALKACSSDLHAVSWDPVARHAGTNVRLVAKGGDPSWDVIQFPTVSPQHTVVVYGRGPEIGSISHIEIAPEIGIPGALYAVEPATPDAEVQLAQLGGATYPFAAGDRDRGLDFDPSFAPVTAGGYAWVVFVSRRTYGTLLTGSAFNSEGDGVKQLWLSAIDLDAPPGIDPSHPALWLPGQDMSTTDRGVVNQRPRWALSPCTGDGECITLP